VKKQWPNSPDFKEKQRHKSQDLFLQQVPAGSQNIKGCF
jgi:hypothetical protein